MKKASHILIIIVAVFASINLKAQLGVFQPGDYKDGVYEKENSTNKRFIPYTSLREGDVTWEKRVWRELDLREKQNHQLYYPIELINGRTSLFQVLAKYILKGEESLINNN